jgi:hypothetical protein
VEWNPPSDRKPLAEVLVWPKNKQFLTTRIITVPNEVHNKFAHADRIPLFQMIGKNVGIRRALGEYVLATNIDILFSNQLMRYLSKKKLEPGFSYRVDRKDIDSVVLADSSKEKILKDCEDHIIRINKKFGTYNYRSIKEKYESWIKHHKDHLFRKSEFIQYGYPLIHTNACGDFTLMAKKHWYDLRGYVELEMYSFHIDSLLLIAAYYSAIQEICLKSPEEIYHIEHSAGSGWTPGKGEAQLYERLNKNSIPFLNWEDCRKYSGDMRSGKYREDTMIHLNTSHWGLMEYDLKETLISA